jgi:hypothetical protein
MEVDPFASVADAMKEGGGEEDSADRFKLAVSILVAVAAITIALIAWGTGIISNKSGDESSAAIASSVKLQQTDFDSRLRSLQDHAGFLASRRNNLSGDLLNQFLQEAPAGVPEAERLDKLRRRREGWDVGTRLAIDGFFSSRYIRNQVGPDGRLINTYDVRKQYETGKAEAARNNDLDAAGHLVGLDTLLDKQASLVGAIVVIGLAIWLMTLAYDARPSYRLYPAALAVVVYAVGAGFAAHTYWLQ